MRPDRRAFSRPRTGAPCGASARSYAVALSIAVRAVGTVLTLAAPCRIAHADTARADEARASYDAGAAAYNARDFEHAATLFAHADELAPNPLVLKLALAAATQTTDPVLGMTLVLRAEERAVDGSLADVARRARSRFEGQVGILRVACATPGGCHARVDARRVADGGTIVVLPGDVDLDLERDDVTTRIHTHVEARGHVEVVEPALTAPPPGSATLPAATTTLPSPPPRPISATPATAPSGLAPGFFWGGLALSAVAGGFTVASAVDTRARHDSYLAGTRAPGARDDGVAAQTRTNILLGATLLTVAVTTVVGLVFTSWRGSPTVAASGRGATFVF